MKSSERGISLSNANVFPAGVPELVEQLTRDAALVDRSQQIPREHFDAFAAAGLYGAIAPSSDGGLELSLDDACALVEELAAACLTTTFVWLQHFRLLATVLNPSTPENLRAMSPEVIGGHIKGGVALGGLLPGPARLRVERTNDGWTVNGEAPWVSGWGIVDVLVVTARDADDNVVTLVIRATQEPGIAATTLHLSAMNASSTVRLDFTDFVVPDDRFVGSQPYAPDQERPEGLRVNGCLALGVARRCCALLGATSLDEDLRRCREALYTADGESIASARAGAAELAVRASHVLAVSRGSRSAISGDEAERSTREAALLLVFASRPAIKDALLDLMI
jgi:alkylation response protein AidB-like acyl-CoA dehydrogenase